MVKSSGTQLFHLVMIVIIRKSLSQKFSKMCKGCQNLDYFYSCEAESLLHCVMICKTRHQCQSVTFEKQVRINCQLHSLNAANCDGLPTSNQITLQKKQIVSDCTLETFHLSSVRVNDQCGYVFASPPLFFKSKSGGYNEIFLRDVTMRNFFLIQIHSGGDSNDYVIMYKYPPYVATDRWIGEAIAEDVWSSFWIMYTKEENGNTTVSIGKGDMVGCDVIVEMSAQFEHNITHVEISDGRWNFYRFE